MSALPVLTEGYGWTEIYPLIRAALDAGISALVRGHPGVGKSALAHQLAADLDLPLVDIRLAQSDPSELAGVYMPDPDNGTMRLMAPEWVKQACDQPTLVFLDEINAAVTRLHQAAAYQIVLERRVGPFRFHPETRVLAAGNLAEDRALVTRLSSALANRFAHFTMRVDVKDWVAWGHANDLDTQILAYIQRKGVDVLYQPADGAFPSPRTWAMASRMMQAARPEDRKRAVAACVGQAPAEALFAWMKLRTRVRPKKIIANGEIPSLLFAEPSLAYATVNTVAEWVIEHEHVPNEWLPNIAAFLQAEGLDAEHALLFLRTLGRRPMLSYRMRSIPEYRKTCGKLVDLRLAAM